MSTHIKDDRRFTDARDDRGPRPVHDVADLTVADLTIEQARSAAEPTTQREQDLMVQLVRQGLDTSLKSVQVRADLARQVGSTAPGSPTCVTVVPLAYDPFEMLLAAQREVGGELVATQRQLTQRVFDTTATVGDDLTLQ